MSTVVQERASAVFPDAPPRNAPREKFDIVLIDDDENSIQLLTEMIPLESFRIVSAKHCEDGCEIIRRRRPAIVLLNPRIVHAGEVDALGKILAMDPGIDVIIVAEAYSPDSAVDAIRHGAYDVMAKPLQVERFQHRLQSWLQEAWLRKKAHQVNQELVEAFQFAGMIGRSAAILDVFSKLRRIAPHYQTALVTGDTGTGKELIAKALHSLGPVSKGPFVVCNCAAIPEHLFESELFGHTRGSFTGAVRDRVGFAKAAHGGTLFLDEIGELPLHLQPKVLRLLQSREIQRVGDSRPERVDVRVVAATNRDLRVLVKERKLREDLFYRLSSIEVRLPRLADRLEDVPLLLRYFLDIYSARYGREPMNLTRRAQAALSRYDWPGNIRELENVIAGCCMMVDGPVIDAHHLPVEVRAGAPHCSGESNGALSMAEMHIRHAREVLQQVNGNRVRAASLLRISRATLYRLLPGDGAEKSGRP
ncbi:MAG: sigma-54 dependent transcriptional regulator [Bryobacteraceae bacterium]